LKKCIITLGIADAQPKDHPQRKRDFRGCIDALRASLDAVGFDGAFRTWTDNYPPGCPPHAESPCAFKPFCFEEMLQQGYELVLWVDATTTVTASLDPVFAEIEKNGYLLFREDHSVGEFCKDAALDTLGITREASFVIPSCWASVIGLNFKTEVAREFLREWKKLAVDGITFPGPRWSGLRGFPATASTDPRVKGHRYDQTAASIVALRLAMGDWQSKDYYRQFFKNDRRAADVAQEPAPVPRKKWWQFARA
jgi:hypothetical protein